jgi:hypothetical protein
MPWLRTKVTSESSFFFQFKAGKVDLDFCFTFANIAGRISHQLIRSMTIKVDVLQERMHKLSNLAQLE